MICQIKNSNHNISGTGDDHLEHFENSICQDIGTTFRHKVKNSTITRKQLTQNKMIHKFPCILLNVYRWYSDAGEKKLNLVILWVTNVEILMKYVP